MLFRNSFFQTKIFFQRSIQSFKSFLSNGYTRLPKSPSCHCTFNPFSCTHGASEIKFSHSYRELDRFYSEYTNNQSHDHNKETTATEKNLLENQDSIMSSNNVNSLQEENNRKRKGKQQQQQQQQQQQHQQQQQQKEVNMSSVSGKLRELEMMDRGNMEHVLDIEEIFYYYSRLTCPTFRGIIDKFIAEMYSEFSGLQAAGGVYVSRKKVRPPGPPRLIKV